MLELKIITAGISDVVFHTTPNVLSILKHNEFRLSSTDAKESEKNYGDKNRRYYLSTARNMESRYIRDNDIVIELDGKKLAQNFKGKTVDYWGEDMRNTPSNKNRDYEQEDRVITKKPVIKDAKKYIKAIHVVLSDREYTQRQLSTLAFFSKKYKIPVLTYENHDTRNARKKSTPINKLPGITPKPPSAKPSRKSYGASDIFGIMKYAKALEKYAKTKEAIGWETFAIQNGVPKRWARYTPWGSDFLSQAKVALHNLNSDKSEEVTTALHKLKRTVKAFGHDDLSDYLSELVEKAYIHSGKMESERRVPYLEKQVKEETNPDYKRYHEESLESEKKHLNKVREKTKYDWFTSLSVPAQKAYLDAHKKSTITDHLVKRNGKWIKSV